MRSVRPIGAVAALTAIALAVASTAGSAQSHTSRAFSGAKVNGGTVTHSVRNGQHVLTLSSDFTVPDTPDPHWQVVDSRGRVYLLDRLPVKGSLAGVRATGSTRPSRCRPTSRTSQGCRSTARGQRPSSAKRSFDTRVLTRARR
jgi:hypothetical protein